MSWFPRVGERVVRAPIDLLGVPAGTVGTVVSANNDPGWWTLKIEWDGDGSRNGYSPTAFSSGWIQPLVEQQDWSDTLELC